MATLRDVAQRAGVSISTVSHVINGYDDINQATRERVLQAIRDLNYHPNAMARNLLKQRSHTIGVVMNGQQSVEHPFFIQLIVALSADVQEAGFGIGLTVYHPEDENLEAFTSKWYQQRLEGLFVMGFAEDTAVVKAAAEGDIPAVFIDTQASGDHSCWVSSDNIGGAYKAVSHLLQQGHERIAFLQGVPNGQIIKDRFTGYIAALKAASIPWDENLYEQADFTKEGAYQAVDRLLDRVRPTAIFCASDLMAFGAINCAQDRGFNVPQDLAVIGFDDIPAAEHVTPALTTVRQSGYAMGRAAVNRLLGLIEGAEDQGSITLPTQLIVRHSCGTQRIEETMRQ